MTINALKTCLQKIIKEYFAGATVIWAEQYATKPNLPLVTLKIGDVSTSLHPVVIIENEEPVSYYPSQTMLEVNLYTKGKRAGNTASHISAAINTAVNDMMDFLKYINSEYVMEKMSDADISILPYGNIKDVSGLVNDTRYEYRSMLEFTVDFMQESYGAAGISSKYIHTWEPTASGGGTEELASKSVGYFEKVEYEEENPNE